MRTVSLLALATLPSLHAAQGLQTAERRLEADAFVLDLWSGNGPAGGLDTQITHLKGPCAGAFSAPFTPRHFAAARQGPPAAILSQSSWPLKELSVNSNTQWIATSSGLFTESGLFAIEFDLPVSPVLGAKLDFYYGVDDYLGTGPNHGIYINEQGVPGGSPGPIPSYNAESSLLDLEVTDLLHPGKNWLYVNMSNLGCAWWGGLMFHARLRINLPNPDECGDATPALVGQTQGSTAGFTTSTPGGSCGVQSDRWYWFVPPATGTMTVTLEKVGGGLFVPALAAFTGSCGALVELGCAQAAGASAGATAQLPVAIAAGEPLLIQVGSSNGATGIFRLRIETPAAGGGVVDPATGQLYKLTPGAVDYATAKALALAEGGRLASITSQAEQDFVHQNLTQGQDVWLGLADDQIEGFWSWESGEPYGGYTNWKAGEPNDAQGSCGEDFGGMFADGTWNDWPQTPPNCGTQVMRGCIEVSGAGKATLDDLGGACGPQYMPVLYSEVHTLGGAPTMALLDSPPGEPGFLFKSAPISTPVPIQDCFLHLDTTSTTLMAGFFVNEYGSASFAFTIPNDPLLVGVQEAWQAQVVLPPTEPLSYSNGLLVTLGN